jgi:hypothetical protein
MGGPMEAEDGVVMSMGSAGTDSEAFGNGCMIVSLLELCTADPTGVPRETSCTMVLIPRGVKQGCVFAKSNGAKCGWSKVGAKAVREGGSAPGGSDGLQ